MANLPVGRNGHAIKTGRLRAADAVRVNAQLHSDQRTSAVTELALGRLLQEDALKGLSHPTDPRAVRVGAGGAAVGVIFSSIFAGIPLAFLFSQGYGPFASPENPNGDLGGSDPLFEDRGFPGEGALSTADGVPDAVLWVFGAFAALGVLLVLASLASLALRALAWSRGRSMVRRGAQELSTSASTGETAEQATERVWPDFAGRLRWSYPRRHHFSSDD